MEAEFDGLVAAGTFSVITAVAEGHNMVEKSSGVQMEGGPEQHY